MECDELAVFDSSGPGNNRTPPLSHKRSMKLSRTLAISASIVLACAFGALLVAFNPNFQRWAVLRAAAGHPGVTLDLERISAGVTTFEASGVRLAMNGVTVGVGSVQGRYSPWAILFSRRLEIESVSAKQVAVDALKQSPSKVGGAVAVAPAGGPGVLANVELPFALVLGRCDIDGTALLPSPGNQAPVQAVFNLTAEGVAPGSEGKVALQATLTNPAEHARVSILRLRTNVIIVESAHRTFDRVRVVSTVDAEGPALPGTNQLRVNGEVITGATGETYVVNVDTSRGDSQEHLLGLKASLSSDRKTLEGEWSVKARTEQIEPFYLGELPVFESEGAGRFSLRPETGEGSMDGRIDASVQNLGVVRPGLGVLGALNLKADFALQRNAKNARLERLSVVVSRESPVIQVTALQPVEIVAGNGPFEVEGATSGEILRATLSAVPVEWIAAFVHGAEVSGGVLTGSIGISADGRKLHASVSEPLRIDRISLVREGRELLRDAAISADGDATWDGGNWQANFRDLALSTPPGDKVSVKLTVASRTSGENSAQASGSYDASLPALLTPWIGGMQLGSRGEFEITWDPGALTVSRLTGNVRTLDGQPVLSTSLQHPFTFGYSDHTIAAAGGGDAELMRIELGRIDLRPLLASLPVQAKGIVTSGRLSLRTSGGKWSVRSIEPLKAVDVDFIGKSGGLLGGLSVRMSPQLDVSSGSGFALQAGDLTVTLADGTPLATATGDLKQAAEGVQASGNFQVELPAAGRLPVLSQPNALAQGRASGEVRAVFGAALHQVEARMTLNGLVARDGGQALPVANIGVRAVRRNDGSGTLEVPILFDRSGVRTDLKFGASVVREGNGHQVDAQLSGQRVALDDVLAVIGVFMNAAGGTASGTVSKAADGAAPPSIAADPSPAWGMFAGRVSLDLKSVSYGVDWSMSGVAGQLVVGPSQISLQNLQAGFGDKGRFAAKGDLRFAGGAQPYRLASQFELTEFDTGPLFKAIDPSRPPTIEGRFNVSGHLDGAGRTVRETAELAKGRFELTSRQGVFRGLRKGTEKLSVATRAVELGAAIGSIFGSDKVKEAAEKMAGNAYFADQLAQELGELKYDQLSLRLARDETLNVQMSDVSLISPGVRLTGRGQITYVAGKTILDQPLNVELALTCLGKVETLFGRAKLLQEESRDELGYARTKYPVVISGTLTKPDAVSYYAKLAAAKLLDSGDN